MTRVYRILRKAFAGARTDGEGSFRFGGRWSNPGTRLAYTSEHLSLAMVEYFVHLDPVDIPADLTLSTASIPDDISRERIDPGALPVNWRDTPAPHRMTEIGDNFVRSGGSAIIIVPSALSPAESNWLINPGHPEFRGITIHRSEPFLYDRRFSRR
ncbi:MAG: RES family NAD+ phosphorylase [Acidobacteriota bacterium]|nr:RES family NAD+ phosphorylase [Acidobacteriota bacterium]